MGLVFVRLSGMENGTDRKSNVLQSARFSASTWYLLMNAPFYPAPPT
jgi:hypothetical protein